MIKYSFESRFYQGPVVDKPVVDKPVVDKPVVDKPVVDNEGSEKVEQMMEIDVSKAFRGFLGAKLIAGGPRTFWTKGEHQKPKKRIQNP